MVCNCDICLTRKIIIGTELGDILMNMSILEQCRYISLTRQIRYEYAKYEDRPFDTEEYGSMYLKLQELDPNIFKKMLVGVNLFDYHSNIMSDILYN